MTDETTAVDLEHDEETDAALDSDDIVEVQARVTVGVRNDETGKTEYHEPGSVFDLDVNEAKRLYELGHIGPPSSADDAESDESEAGITGTEIPDDFPAREDLIGAGHGTLEQVLLLAFQNRLESVDGIGPKTADEIHDFIAGTEETED